VSLNLLKGVVEVFLAFEWSQFALTAETVSAGENEGRNAQKRNHRELESNGNPHSRDISKNDLFSFGTIGM
jgi:hypothetical protein